jgi:hypothetical protein
MTTAEKLREVLQTVEPGWQADVAAVRKRANWVQLKRRITGVVAVAAATVGVVALVPAVLRIGEPGPATASLGTGGAIPTTPAEARRVTKFSPRTGPLQLVRSVGNQVAVPYVSGWRVHLLPPAAGDPGTGRICLVDQTDCRQLARSADGWVTGRPSEGSAGNIGRVQAAAYWVVEAPVGGVVATVDHRQVPTQISDLGFGYKLVTVRLPARALSGEAAMSAPDPEAVWVFDPSGRLIARHRA